MFCVQGLYEPVGGRRVRGIDGTFELRYECVKHRRRLGVAEQRRIEEVAPFEDNVRVPPLDERIQTIRGTEVLRREIFKVIHLLQV